MSRNPTFLGQLLLLVGVALAVPSVPTLLAPILFFLSASLQIRVEEKVLGASNDEEYDRFYRTVPRWFGWPKRVDR